VQCDKRVDQREKNASTNFKLTVRLHLDHGIPCVALLASLGWAASLLDACSGCGGLGCGCLGGSGSHGVYLRVDNLLKVFKLMIETECDGKQY
jgi:hypothetical protein